MYHEFFGLTQAPFRITPNTDFFFGGGNRGPILEALVYAVTHGEGIVKVSGEVGSGKTMLCNMLMERLPQNVETVYIANPGVSPDEILHAIAFDLHLGTAPTATRLEVTHTLQDYLLKRHAEGKRVVVFVEESQGMPLATLEEIRLLSNLETRNDKLLQIVLFGQPELDENLRQPNIRQLRDRITHSFTLGPLNASEIREYLMFRMRAAGYHGPDLFTDKVVHLIARASAGLTRRVNLIADKALLAAFSENTHTVKPQHVMAALRDSEFTQNAPGAGRAMHWGWVSAALVGMGIGTAGYAWFSRHQVREPAPVASAQPTVTPGTTTGNAAAVEAPQNTVPATHAGAVVTTPDSRSETLSSPTPSAEKSGKVSDDILQQRLAETTLWITKENGATWTLQTLSTASEADLRNYLRFIQKTIEINSIFVYRADGNTDQKPPVFSVFYGTYDSRTAAEQKMADLPAQLKSNRPLPRTVQSIRDGIR